MTMEPGFDRMSCPHTKTHVISLPFFIVDVEMCNITLINVSNRKPEVVKG
jgi:hypothetical protein